MDGQMILELVGYLGSGLVIVSMLMTSVMRLRVINSIGSGIFTVYAILIHSYPTALMNLFLVGINVFYLIRLRNRERSYDVLELKSSDEFLAYFMKYYRQDIRQFFPDFETRSARECLSVSPGMDSAPGAEPAAPGQPRAFIVLCEQSPAGILLGSLRDGILDVELDYTTPVYRDCSAGSYLYERLPEYGIRRLVCDGAAPEHEAYLRRMGFAPEEGRFVKVLGALGAGGRTVR